MHHQTPRHIDEAEKPFWISYSDLMTALMILFLVVMVVSLTSISQQAIKIKEEGLQKIQSPAPAESEVQTTDKEDPQTSAELKRLAEIQTVCAELGADASQKNVNVRVNCSFNKIDFGEAGRFERGEYKLNGKGEQMLKDIVPIILEVAQSPMGQKWLRRVHIQGFTDTDGSYLYNLNLSLKRSEWVMCKILANSPDVGMQLNAEQRNLVKKLFLAGGVSFNDSRSSKDASRRVELKLEFYDESGVDSVSDDDLPVQFGDDVPERCQI